MLTLASFEVHLPCGMIRVRFSLDLDVTAASERGRMEQLRDLPLSAVFLLSEEHHPRPLRRAKYFRMIQRLPLRRCLFRAHCHRALKMA
jgi:hypothetical protein